MPFTHAFMGSNPVRVTNLKLTLEREFLCAKNDIINLVIYMKSISSKIVRFMLLGFSTLILITLICSSIHMWLLASFDNKNLVSYVKGEELVYLFFSIACIFQLILMYTLTFYYKINKKHLKTFNMIVFVLGALFLISSCVIDYKLYYLLYDDNVSFIIGLIIFYYATLLPGLLIFKSETRALKEGI